MNHPRPVLRVIKGDPSPEELAALIAVLNARAAAAESESADSRADLGFGLRQPVRVGRGAWVASGWTPGTRTRADW